MPQQHDIRLNARFYDCEVPTAGGAPVSACDDPLPVPLREEDVERLGDGEVTTLTYAPSG